MSKTIYIATLNILDLQQSFQEYLPVEKENISWIQNSFEKAFDNSQLSVKEQLQIIDISTDSQLKITFNQVDIKHFWLQILHEYPEIAKRAFTHLMSFVLTYICERSFSLYTATKTEYRNRLNVENDNALTNLSYYPRYKYALP